VLLGKLNTTEGAMGGYSQFLQPGQQLPVNPWDERAWTGSSSSGSGVAAAAGFGYAALGSDTGGSIRYPAMGCGVVGLKPTWGRISRHLVLPLAETLDTVGVLARSTADAAIATQIMSGRDVHDPTSLPTPPPPLFHDGPDWSLAPLLPPRGRQLRIGVDAVYNSTDVDPELLTAVQHALDALVAATNATLVPCALPPPETLRTYVNAWGAICAPEALAAHIRMGTWPHQAEAYGTWFRGWLRQGEGVSGVDQARARILRSVLTIPGP